MKLFKKRGKKLSLKLKKNKAQFVAPETLPNRMEVPENTIVAIPQHPMYRKSHKDVVVNLKKMKKRDWFIKHAYFCLPLAIGNQYGFGIRSLHSFRACWKGGNDPSNVELVFEKGPPEVDGNQHISSHFGMGTITVQNRFALRTPENVNLITLDPPNMILDGLRNLFAVVEADNLRRDFTFNLKLTRPNHWVEVEQGQVISGLLPYPRHFIDNFQIESAYDLFPDDIVEEEIRTMDYFGQEREMETSIDPAAVGGRYMRGEDIYGFKFKDHQKKLD